MSYYIKAEALPGGAPTRVLGLGALLLHPVPRAVVQTAMVRAWHLHVQGPRQPGLLEVALFPEGPIWPFVLEFLTSQGQKQLGVQERTRVLLELTPPAVFRRLSMPSGNWGASGPKCSHADVETGFSSKRPQQNLPASFIHATPSQFLPNSLSHL